MKILDLRLRITLVLMTRFCVPVFILFVFVGAGVEIGLEVGMTDGGDVGVVTGTAVFVAGNVVDSGIIFGVVAFILGVLRLFTDCGTHLF